MNRKTEQVICLIWISLAFYVCLASLRLKFGTFKDPGPGFFPFLAGAFLGVFAIIHLAIIKFLSQKKAEVDFSAVISMRFKNVIPLFISLLLYTFLLPMLGYLLDTLLLLLFIFIFLERKKWWSALIGSLVVIGITYLIFEVWLNIQFPKGFLGIG
jgi:hypothetical protein